MKRKLLFLLSVIILGLSVQGALAQADPYTPERGSAERKAILDAMRKNRGDNDIVYTPKVFLVQNGYAWVVASAAGGSNQYEDEIVLIRKVSGKWRFAAAPCVEEACTMSKEIKKIQKKYPKAPKAIFKVE
jgi:hypothetical protein